MTPINNDAPLPELARVSRILRFLPFLSFAIVGLGAAAAGYYTHVAAAGFANSELAGIGAIGRALATGTSAITVSLFLACLVGAVTIIVHSGMMFANRKTASPSSIQFLIIAIVSGLAMACGWWGLTYALLAPFSSATTAQGVADQVSLYVIASIVLGLMSALAALVLALVPQQGHLGRKYGPLLLMVAAELIMIVTLVYITLQIRSVSQMGLGM